MHSNAWTQMALEWVSQWWIVLPLSLILICVFLPIVYLFRVPRWFHTRRERRELEAAAREALAHELARGEITVSEYRETEHRLHLEQEPGKEATR